MLNRLESLPVAEFYTAIPDSWQIVFTLARARRIANALVGTFPGPSLLGASLPRRCSKFSAQRYS